MIHFHGYSVGLRVPSRWYKVQASMCSQVGLLVPLRLFFLSHISLMLIINEVDDGAPQILVVHVVTEPGVST